MSSPLQSRFAPWIYILMFFAGFLTASVWFHPQAYLANLAPVVTALSALALVWLVYVWLSAHAGAKSERLLREKLMQQEAVHPVLHASVQQLESRPEKLVLAVRNHGKGLAKHLRFCLETPSEHTGSVVIAAAMAKLPIFSEGFDQLAVGETYGGVFADIRTLMAELPERTFGGVVKLVVECENAFGEVVSSETVLDVSMLNAVDLDDETEVKPRKKLLY